MLTVRIANGSRPDEARVRALGLDGVLKGEDGLLHVLVLDHHLLGRFVSQVLVLCQTQASIDVIHTTWNSLMHHSPNGLAVRA